jgi:ubiquinone biosynthesis protein
MRLRPELVLLQKTMVTVEGVSRRIWPRLDIWVAAEPVVRRWIARELSPARRLFALADEARTILDRLAAREPIPDVPVTQSPQAGGVHAWSFVAGLAAAALIWVVAALMR